MVILFTSRIVCSPKSDYQRYELQWRLSLFFSASILAGGFGGVSVD